MIGALTALSPTIKPTDLQESALPSSAIKGATLEPRFSANGLYWAMTAMVSGVASAIILTNMDRGNDQIAASVLVAALALPLFQLGASLISLFVILGSNRLGKEVRLRHLGKITLRSFIGGLIGIAIMLPLFARC